MNRYSLASIAIAAVIGPAMGVVAAGAVDWPTKMVRVIVPYAAGSATDLNQNRSSPGSAGEAAKV
jgi:tripartite-type tricarboxylate transporter receptor subunit TctC